MNKTKIDKSKWLKYERHDLEPLFTHLLTNTIYYILITNTYKWLENVGMII